MCDGPSFPRRSVLPFRYEVKRVDFSTQISEFLVFWNDTPLTARRAHDGPSWVPLSQSNFPEIKSAAQND